MHFIIISRFLMNLVLFFNNSGINIHSLALWCRIKKFYMVSHFKCLETDVVKVLIIYILNF